jgi:hypothetical protein
VGVRVCAGLHGGECAQMRVCVRVGRIYSKLLGYISIRENKVDIVNYITNINIQYQG